MWYFITMEIIRSVESLTWILMSVFTLCHCTMFRVNNQANSSNDAADMISMLERAISGNAAVYDPALQLHKGAVVNLPERKPLLNMTRSTWSLHTTNLRTDKEHLDSVSLPDTSAVALDSKNKGLFWGNVFVPSGANKINTKQSLIKSKDINSTKLAEKISGLNTNIGQKSNTAKSGVYIPLEKLSRLRRQTNNVSTTGTANSHARVLLLMKPNTEESILNAQDKFLGKVHMLVKQPNISTVQLNYSSLHHPISSVESRNHIQNISTSRMGDTLREVTQSEPAIQRINNLNKINLPLEFTTVNTSTQDLNNQQDRNFLQPQNMTLRNSISQTPSLLDVQARNLQFNNLRNNSQQGGEHVIGRQQNIQSTSNRRTEVIHNRQTVQRFTNRQTGSQSNNNKTNSRNISVRGPRVISRSKQLIRNLPRRVVSRQGVSRLVRMPVERQLTLQQPVSSNRINVRPSRPSRSRTSVAGSRLNRPLVRTISSHNLNQQRRGGRVVVPRITQTPRRTRIQRRRPPARRQVIRRRPGPPDPFTRRFSAGFQRGSNLLHQPPLDLTSFGDTPGFNTLTPAETRLPPFSPPAGLFGGIALPGLFSGPTIM